MTSGLRKALPRGALELPPRILIIEDDENLRRSLCHLLELRGYRVDVAMDGAEGVRRARAIGPDAIIIDLGLPTIDGWAAISLLRARPQGALRPHIIAMSGLSDARSRERAFEVGCDEYIVKASGVRSLASALDAYFVRKSHPVAERANDAGGEFELLDQICETQSRR